MGGPVTATSANLSGEPPSTTPEAVRAAFGDRVDMILGSGPTQGGPPSTILACFGEVVWLVRDGAVPYAEVERVLSEADQG
jgi:L-threonylcarbamoyladenylate synthase